MEKMFKELRQKIKYQNRGSIHVSNLSYSGEIPKMAYQILKGYGCNVSKYVLRGIVEN